MKMYNIFCCLLLVIIILACDKKKENNIKSENKSSDDTETIKRRDSVKRKDLDQYKFENLTDLKMFKDFKLVSSSMLDTEERNIKPLAISYLKKEGVHILALERINSKTTNILLDTVQFISKNKNVFTDLIECQKINDTLIKNIYAFSEYEDKEFLNNTLKAWNVNINTNKFLKINPETVRCLNIGYDHED